MSEKRFVLCKKGDKEYIEDNDCIQLYSFDVLCEMLNLLNDENRQLKEEIKRLEKMIWKIQWKFQQEVGIEKARKYYQEIDKEMKE